MALCAAFRQMFSYVYLDRKVKKMGELSHRKFFNALPPRSCEILYMTEAQSLELKTYSWTTIQVHGAILCHRFSRATKNSLYITSCQTLALRILGLVLTLTNNAPITNSETFSWLTESIHPNCSSTGSPLNSFLNSSLFHQINHRTSKMIQISTSPIRSFKAFRSLQGFLGQPKWS